MAAAPVQPRAAVTRKSGTLDFTDNYSHKMIRWRDDINRQGLSDLQAYREFQEINIYIKYLEGTYWTGRPVWRSQFYDNYLADQRREALAALSDIRPSITVSCEVDAYQDQAKIAQKYIQYLWEHNDLDLKLASWIDHALFGTGFLKITSYSPGLFEFTALGMDQVMPVLMNDDLQQAVAVRYKNYQTIQYYLARFGERAQGLERYSTNITSALQSNDMYIRPDWIPEYTWNAFSPAMKKIKSLRGGPTKLTTEGRVPFPTIELQEIFSEDWSVNEAGHDVLVKHPDLDVREHNFHYIVPPKCRLYPRKRLVVFGGDRVLYDGPSPYWHGLYPFAMLQLNPCVWAPGGVSKYRDLIPLTRSINRIGVGIEESVMRALNGTWVARRGSIPEHVWESFDPGRPGQKILLNPVARNGDFQELTAAQLPSQVGAFQQYLIETIKRRSGSLDVSGLSRKNQTPGGDAVQEMRDSQSAPFRMEGRYVEAALKRAAYQVVSGIFQFATLDRRLKILGADGMTWSDFDYLAGSMIPSSSPKEDHWRQFPIHIAQGSSSGQSRYQQSVLALALHQRGALSTAGLYRQLNYPERWDDVKKELADELGAGIGLPPVRGRTPRMTRNQQNGQPV